MKELGWSQHAKHNCDTNTKLHVIVFYRTMRSCVEYFTCLWLLVGVSSLKLTQSVFSLNKIEAKYWRFMHMHEVYITCMRLAVRFPGCARFTLVSLARPLEISMKASHNKSRTKLLQSGTAGRCYWNRDSPTWFGMVETWIKLATAYYVLRMVFNLTTNSH